MKAKRRKHGKRSIVARLSSVAAKVRRTSDKTIERDARIELAYALLSLQHARRFVMNAERLTCKTL